MTFLELCQTLRQEAGVAGSGPVTVTNQSGELGRIVNWIKQGYEDVQDKNASWNFLRSDYTFNCVPGTQVYTQTSVPLLANWKPHGNRIYLTTGQNEAYLQFVDWEEFRDCRLFGASRTQTERPTECSINPASGLMLWPIPDAAYTVTGEYFRTAHVMVNDTDLPIFPRHHMAIVFNALMRYAAYVSDPSVYAYAQKEYLKTISRLENDQLEQIKFAGPLA